MKHQKEAKIKLVRCSKCGLYIPDYRLKDHIDCVEGKYKRKLKKVT